MLPIRDTVRSNSFPAVNWALIGVNSVVFLYEATLAPSRFNQLIAVYGLVPARLHCVTINEFVPASRVRRAKRRIYPGPLPHPPASRWQRGAESVIPSIKLKGDCNGRT